MRLIDADKCPCNECTMFCDKNCCDAFVEWRKGCAYDIDKVVEQLEEKIEENPDCSLADYRAGLFEAIEIVKSGGKV